MKEFNCISDEQRKHLLSMLLAGKLDLDNIPRHYIGVPYGDDPKQKMNIYLPENGDCLFPVIFFIHGGGWQSGSKNDTQVRPFLHGINRGYAVISCGYRLLPDTCYPGNLFDIKAALRFISQHGEKYNLDSTRIAISGASAGAHLALMAAFTQGQPAFEGGDTRLAPKLLAVVDQFGPTDFLNENVHFEESGYPRMNPPSAPGKGTAAMLLRADSSKNPELCSFLSPINNIHSNIPPTLILHGKYDPMVPYKQSVTLFDKINAVCGAGRAKIIISDDCTHADTKYENEPYTTEIFTFLDNYLK